ncbi:hypothetical protein BDZ89DRAFT_1087261, partial [Hymenopellis radicata]
MCVVLPPDNICDKSHRSVFSVATSSQIMSVNIPQIQMVVVMPSEYAIHRSLLFAVLLVLRYIWMRTPYPTTFGPSHI